jgi:hypothetical protein
VRALGVCRENRKSRFGSHNKTIGDDWLGQVARNDADWRRQAVGYSPLGKSCCERCRISVKRTLASVPV